MERIARRKPPKRTESHHGATVRVAAKRLAQKRRSFAQSCEKKQYKK